MRKILKKFIKCEIPIQLDSNICETYKITAFAIRNDDNNLEKLGAKIIHCPFCTKSSDEWGWFYLKDFYRIYYNLKSSKIFQEILCFRIFRNPSLGKFGEERDNTYNWNSIIIPSCGRVISKL